VLPAAPEAPQAVVDSADLPIPTMKIDRIAPRYSYELALQMGYGDVAYYRKDLGPWIGMGIRGSWGKNLGAHRVGFEGIGSTEGAFGVYTTMVLEPRLIWDWIGSIDHGVQLGASLGPAFEYHNRAIVGPNNNEVALTVSPTAAFRVGYSEGWSRVGRRFFAFLEPRVRYSPAGESKDQPFSPGINLVIGSGRGY
jgi:hypothetical protein